MKKILRMTVLLGIAALVLGEWKRQSDERKATWAAATDHLDA